VTADNERQQYTPITTFLYKVFAEKRTSAGNLIINLNADSNTTIFISQNKLVMLLRCAWNFLRILGGWG